MSILKISLNGFKVIPIILSILNWCRLLHLNRESSENSKISMEIIN
jgi:hypothetical protein